LGTRTGPGFSYEDIVPAIERVIETYLALRSSKEETFLAAYRRLGIAPFKSALYEVEHVAA
jgi:sulfite reductase (NADPH) hemoprotein beta-component